MVVTPSRTHVFTSCAVIKELERCQSEDGAQMDLRNYLEKQIQVHNQQESGQVQAFSTKNITLSFKSARNTVLLSLVQDTHL